MTPNCFPSPQKQQIQLKKQENEEFLFILDLTSSFRFETRREIIRTAVIQPILQKFSSKNESIKVTFAGLTGSIPFGLYCSILKTFQGELKEVSNEIGSFLSKGIDKIIDFGSTADSLSGYFGIGGTVESICTSLCHFKETSEQTKRHLILLPTSYGTEILPPFRTCTDEQYAAATLPQLLAILRGRKISLSLVAPGLSDSTVIEQFLVFKCNEKIGAMKFIENLGSDWVVRLSAGLTGEEQTPAVKPIDDNELLNQTLLKLSTMPPEERVVALKTLLDPNTSNFSSSFRQKFAAAVKSRLQQDTQTQQSQVNQQVQVQVQTHIPIQTQTQIPQNQMPPVPVVQGQIFPLRTNNSNFSQRRASQDSSTTFWSGCIRFLEKQQSYLFRVQFIAVDSQTALPRTSLENWPHELTLTGLLDSKKESIQAGLSVGYAFKVNVASADSAIASYLMTRMCQNSQTPSHLACFRISQDVLIMLRVLDDLQFIGYLIDRRFPKSNLTPAAQAASNTINSLTAAKTPMSTTLSTGIEGMSIGGRRPSFDVKISNVKSQIPSRPTIQPNTNANGKPLNSISNTTTTSYISYPQFIQQQQQKQQQQQSPVKIAAISCGTTVTTNQLLTDPQAILQKLRTPAQRNHASPSIETANFMAPPSIQPNEGHGLGDDNELDQSFVDAWLN